MERKSTNYPHTSEQGKKICPNNYIVRFLFVSCKIAELQNQVDSQTKASHVCYKTTTAPENKHRATVHKIETENKQRLQVH